MALQQNRDCLLSEFLYFLGIFSLAHSSENLVSVVSLSLARHFLDRTPFRLEVFLGQSGVEEGFGVVSILTFAKFWPSF